MAALEKSLNRYVKGLSGQPRKAAGHGRIWWWAIIDWAERPWSLVEPAAFEYECRARLRSKRKPVTPWICIPKALRHRYEKDFQFWPNFPIIANVDCAEDLAENRDATTDFLLKFYRAALISLDTNPDVGSFRELRLHIDLSQNDERDILPAFRVLLKGLRAANRLPNPHPHSGRSDRSRPGSKWRLLELWDCREFDLLDRPITDGQRSQLSKLQRARTRVIKRASS